MPDVWLALLATSPTGGGWIGNWRPGIGDPTFVGWLTVAAYLGAALLCYRLRGRFSPESDLLRRQERRFWGLLAAVLLFLGVNKQLDLQTAMTETLRAAAKAEGWYEMRRSLQFLFVATMALALPVLAALFYRRARRFPPATKTAGMGLLVIGAFVVIRAASFHHVDQLLGSRLAYFSFNWIFELGGIAVVLWGARRRAGQLNRSPFSK